MTTLNKEVQEAMEYFNAIFNNDEEALRKIRERDAKKVYVKKDDKEIFEQLRRDLEAKEKENTLREISSRRRVM